MNIKIVDVIENENTILIKKKDLIERFERMLDDGQFMEEIENVCIKLAHSNKKVTAIKFVRAIFGLGLKQSKDFVDNILY